VQATQVFSRRLVEDFGYPLDHIITRPQFRVSRRPSETKKSYPVDIAVFSNAQRLETDCSIIVECKSDTEKAGRKQLEIYLTLSDAFIGVWFNGKSHHYIHKYYENGKVIFKELPTLPRFGQRVEDIGLYKRSDLETSASLKAVFRDIRHHLAGNTVGITHDIRLAHQIINVLFCKIYDETTKGPDELVEFRAGVDESDRTVRDRLLNLFTSVKTRFSGQRRLEPRSLRPGAIPRHRRELCQHFVHEHVDIGKRIPRARRCLGGADGSAHSGWPRCC
jgi:type I restriction enzyme M protein